MPAFVIHALGVPPRKIVVDSTPVRVGRDPSADIILEEPDVSRDHAAFVAEDGGRWLVSCVSDTNPIVVDGAVVTAGAPVREGTQVVVGTRHVIVFSESAFTANKYMSDKPMYEQGVCDGCRWTGMIGQLSSNPRCPRCGTAIHAAAAYGPDSLNAAGGMDVQQRRRFAVGTAKMDPEQAKEMLEKVKAAKASRIERADDRDPDKPHAKLAENAPVVLGKQAGAGLRLTGLVFGQGVSVAWNGSRYVATSRLSFPSMRVNGKKTKSSPLANGDVIEIGSNKFKLVTGKA